MKYDCSCSYSEESKSWCHFAWIDTECVDDSGNVEITTNTSVYGCRGNEAACIEDNCSDVGIWIEKSSACSREVRVCYY